MGQEFVIKSQQIEDKINQLLPSQGGYQPGVDFSASTTVIPIVDLTETAEGSTLRQDLQTSFSLINTTTSTAQNNTVTVANTPGFYRIFGNYTMQVNTIVSVNITDGVTTKNVLIKVTSAVNPVDEMFDFNVKLEAGDSLTITSNSAGARIQTSTRQLADVNGNLVNP